MSDDRDKTTKIVVTDIEEKMIEIESSIWRGTGNLATYEEVLAAKEKAMGLRPFLKTEREESRWQGLIDSLARVRQHVMPQEMKEEEMRKYGVKKHRHPRK